jgi:histidyl-tRNA synthetase
MTGTTQIKRYSIAPVFRRDQPSITRGRLRQFHQCDFDIAGTYDPMIPDAQILRIVSECFDALKLDVTIKLNHRRILDGLFAVAGVPADKFRTISSAVDKLDKMSWEDVRKEMVEEKGLAGDVADAVGRAVQRSGTLQETTAALKSDLASASEPNPDIKAGLEDMELLAAYLKAYGVADRVEFDLSLARGLDYYTGLIYECIPKTGAKSPHESVGSIAAGGRYDNLVGMYGKTKIPCVGVSFGVDRIHTILKQRESNTATKMQVFVMAFGNKTFNGLMVERMEVTAELWNAGIRAETVPKVKSKLPQQFKAADAAGASIAVILGDDELAAGKVKVKVLGLPNDDPEKDGVLVDKTTLVDEVRKRLEQVRL